MVEDLKKTKEETYKKEVCQLEENIRILLTQKNYLLETVRLEQKWQKLYLIEKHSRRRYQKAFEQLSYLPFLRRMFRFNFYRNRLSGEL